MKVLSKSKSILLLSVFFEFASSHHGLQKRREVDRKWEVMAGGGEGQNQGLGKPLFQQTNVWRQTNFLKCVGFAGWRRK